MNGHKSFSKGKGMRGLLIVILLAAIGVLGYLYWEEQQDSVSIELEAPEIKAPN